VKSRFCVFFWQAPFCWKHLPFLCLGAGGNLISLSPFVIKTVVLAVSEAESAPMFQSSPKPDFALTGSDKRVSSVSLLVIHLDDGIFRQLIKQFIRNHVLKTLLTNFKQIPELKGLFVVRVLVVLYSVLLMLMYACQATANEGRGIVYSRRREDRGSSGSSSPPPQAATSYAATDHTTTVHVMHTLRCRNEM
jgi:hypothetical protein